MTGDHINTLTQALLSLDEPWRGRFLALLAQRANERGRTAHYPSRENIAQWLRDADIYREFVVLLDEWQGTGTWVKGEAPPQRAGLLLLRSVEKCPR
jgi:hypothetical protein